MAPARRFTTRQENWAIENGIAHHDGGWLCLRVESAGLAAGLGEQRQRGRVSHSLCRAQVARCAVRIRHQRGKGHLPQWPVGRNEQPFGAGDFLSGCLWEELANRLRPTLVPTVQWEGLTTCRRSCSTRPSSFLFDR